MEKVLCKVTGSVPVRTIPAVKDYIHEAHVERQMVEPAGACFLESPPCIPFLQVCVRVDDTYGDFFSAAALRFPKGKFQQCTAMAATPVWRQYRESFQIVQFSAAWFQCYVPNLLVRCKQSVEEAALLLQHLEPFQCHERRVGRAVGLIEAERISHGVKGFPDYLYGFFKFSGGRKESDFRTVHEFSVLTVSRDIFGFMVVFFDTDILHASVYTDPSRTQVRVKTGPVAGKIVTLKAEVHAFLFIAGRYAAVRVFAITLTAPATGP